MIEKLKPYAGYAAAALVGASLAVVFVPKKVVTKTVQVETKQTDIDRDKHKETTVTESVKPDGTKQTVTHITEETNTQKTVKDAKREESEKTVVTGSPRTTISALAGTRFSAADPVDFGLSVERQLIGPFNVGAFGFKSGLVGLSLGISF
jgi:hypothetical protein